MNKAGSNEAFGNCFNPLKICGHSLKICVWKLKNVIERYQLCQVERSNIQQSLLIATESMYKRWKMLRDHMQILDPLSFDYAVSAKKKKKSFKTQYFHNSHVHSRCL